MLAILKALNVDHQLVSLRTEEGTPFPEPYWIFNLLSVIDAMDMSQSDYTVYPESAGKLAGKMRKIKQLVLDEDKLQGVHMFRLKNRPTYVFVSEELKAKLENEGVTGIRFSEISN